MATFNINAFKGELQFGGARSSLFEVVLTNPVNSTGDTDLTFLCKAASLPASTLNPIQTFYKGRAINLAGNRTFDPWNITIYNDEDFKIRNAMEQWVNAINSFEGNVRTLPGSSPALYKSTAEVRQMSQDGAVLRTYKFIGVWPQSIAEIPLDFQTDAVEEFSAILQFDYFYIADSTTGDAGGL